MITPPPPPITHEHTKIMGKMAKMVFHFWILIRRFFGGGGVLVGFFRFKRTLGSGKQKNWSCLLHFPPDLLELGGEGLDLLFVRLLALVRLHEFPEQD